MPDCLSGILNKKASEADGALYRAKRTGKNRFVLRDYQEEQFQPYSVSGTGVTKKSASGTETPKG